MSQHCAEERPRFSAPIEIERLSQNTAGNRKLERELLALFRAQTGAYLAALENAGDDERWHDAAHTLKGAAQAVGAMRIAGLAEEAERLVGEGAKSRASTLENIRRAVDEARRFIDYQLLDSAH
jgi:HPt (histidine-containing phosphotransfer) domain-containing protein